MKRLGKIYQIISILVYTFIFAAIWLPWVAYGGKSYCLIAYLRMVKGAGGIVAMTEGSPDMVASYYLSYLTIAAAVLAGVYVVGRLVGKPLKPVYAAVRWCEFIYTAASVIFAPLVPMIWTYIVPILCLAEYVFGQYVEQRDEILKEARLNKERERFEKNERKRRLYFPGRYSSSYYKMILKNVKFHARNYVMLIITGSFLMLFLFLVFALRHAFMEYHTAEAVTGGQTQKILLNAVWMGLLINAVLMGLSFSYYIRNKMREENMLVVLGIRSSALRAMMLMEYAGCLLCSGVIGSLAGSIVFHVLVGILGRSLPVSAAGLPASAFLAAWAVFAVAALIAAAVNSHVYDHMRWSASGLLAPKKNRIPGVFGWVLGAVGLICMVWSLGQLTGRGGGESEDRLVDYLFGLVLVMLCAGAAQMKGIRRKDERYFRYLFEKFPFLTGFGQNMKKIYLLTVIAFLVTYPLASVYGGNASALDLEEQYPYDFVCIATAEEKEDFQSLKEQYSLELEQYPMTTVFSLMPENITLINSIKDIFAFDYKAVAGGRQVMIEPPIQIGVPESVYRSLKKNLHGEEGEALNLAGEEIAVVYQEDVSAKAHLLDWSGTADTLNLQTMSPDAELFSYSAFTGRRVAGEERDILTGVYGEGKEQNLVVFSDEFFAKIYENEALYLIRAADGDYDAVEEWLSDRAAGDGQLRYYGRKAMIQDREAERYLKIVVWLFMLVMVGVSGIYLLFIKFCFEMDEIVARYRFLDCMGMHRKRLKKTLQREMLPFFLVPLLAGGGSGLLFTGLMFHVRMYTGSELLRYLLYVTPVWGIYWLVQTIVYLILKKVLLDKIEGRATWQS